MLRHRFESVKYAPSLKAPTYVLRAAMDAALVSAELYTGAWTDVERRALARIGELARHQGDAP